MKKKLFLGLLAILMVVLLYLLFKESNEPRHSEMPNSRKLGAESLPQGDSPGRRPAIPSKKSGTTHTADSDIKAQLEELVKDRPVEFYGKVLDEKGNPIEGVHVKFQLVGYRPEKFSEIEEKTDSQGLFRLSGKFGRILTVQLSKEGYYTPRDQPDRFTFGASLDVDSHNPHPETPVLFYLNKKGKADILNITKGAFRIPKDGSPVEVDLHHRKVVPTGTGQLRVQCWTEDNRKDRFNRYDWRCRVSIPSGGLIRRVKELAFEAPEKGYESSDEIEMPASLGQDWASNVQRDYFVRLPDGTYGRLTFRIIAGGDHFFRFELFLNPIGSRNLEYDPEVQKKAVRSE